MVLTPLSAIFQLCHGSQFCWWRKLEYPEKTTNLSQITDKLLSHNVVLSTIQSRWPPFLRRHVDELIIEINLSNKHILDKNHI